MRTVEALALQSIRRALNETIRPEVESGYGKHLGMLSDAVLARMAARERRAEVEARFTGELRVLLGGEGPLTEAEAQALLAQAVARDPAGADTLITGVSRIQARVLEAWEAEVAAAAAEAQPAATDAPEPDLVALMQAYLRARRPDEAGLVVTKAYRLPGGRSKITYVVELTGGGDLPDGLILRMDSSRQTIGPSVVAEYPLIVAAYAGGAPAPETYWLEEDPNVLGAPFIVFRRMSGAPAGDLYGPKDATPELGKGLARALAQVHAVDLKTTAAPPHASARDAVGALLDAYEAMWARDKGGPSVMATCAFAWLRARLGCIEGPAALVHGDAHFSNLLAEGDRLVCLLDWEFWHAGDPAEDLAYCKPFVEQFMAWDDFVGAYVEAGGAAPSQARLAFFNVWRMLRNMVLCAGVRAQLANDQEIDLESAAIAVNTYERMEAAMARDFVKTLAAG